MAQGSDIDAKITALAQSFETMKATFDKAMEDVAATVPAGHAAVLDGFVKPLDDLKAKFDAFNGEIPAKVGTISVHDGGVSAAKP